MVQWLGLCTFTAEATGSITGQGTKIPPKKKEEGNVALSLSGKQGYICGSDSGRRVSMLLFLWDKKWDHQQREERVWRLERAGNNVSVGISSVVQWLRICLPKKKRICLPMQGPRVWSLLWEDSIWHGVTKLHSPQLLNPGPSLLPQTRETTAMRSLRTTTREWPHAMPSCFSHVQLFATPWTVARQAPLSMGMLQARILKWVAISFSRGSSKWQGSNRKRVTPACHN